MTNQPAPTTSQPPSSSTRARLLRWGVVAAWCALIFAASAVPGSSVPGRFGTIAHFTEYAILAALVYAALRLDVSRVRAASIAIALASGYGITDEFHQSFVPLRVPDPVDWAVDTAGAILGVCTVWLWERLTFKRTSDV